MTATKTHRQDRLILNVSIIFRDLRMICDEKLYFTTVFVKIIKYYCFSYTYILITLILLPVILEGEWQMKFLTY